MSDWPYSHEYEPVTAHEVEALRAERNAAVDSVLADLASAQADLDAALARESALRAGVEAALNALHNSLGKETAFRLLDALLVEPGGDNA
jgi:outer membrane protein TolC